MVSLSGRRHKGRRSARTKPALPDMRARGYTFGEDPDGKHPPSDMEIDALHRKHRFPETFDLLGELTRIWGWWRVDVAVGADRPASSSKKLLAEIAKRSRALEQALSLAGPAEKQRMSSESVILKFDSVRELLSELSTATAVAASRIEPSPPGARGDPELMQLLVRLVRLWKFAHGLDAPRITKTGSQYQGRFFDFVQDIFRLPAFQIRKQNYALGKAIEKAWAIAERRLDPD